MGSTKGNTRKLFRLLCRGERDGKTETGLQNRQQTSQLHHSTSGHGKPEGTLQILQVAHRIGDRACNRVETIGYWDIRSHSTRTGWCHLDDHPRHRAGGVPSNCQLSARFGTTKFFTLPRASGIGPVHQPAHDVILCEVRLHLKRNAWSPGRPRAASDRSVVPPNRLPAMLRNCRCDRLPKVSGIEPVNARNEWVRSGRLRRGPCGRLSDYPRHYFAQPGWADHSL